MVDCGHASIKMLPDKVNTPTTGKVAVTKVKDKDPEHGLFSTTEISVTGLSAHVKKSISMIMFELDHDVRTAFALTPATVFSQVIVVLIVLCRTTGGLPETSSSACSM